MNIRSAKAKGRKLCQETRELILKAFPVLDADDVRINPASCPGEDLHLSPHARHMLPLAFECKNQETTKPWDWYKQASRICQRWKMSRCGIQ